MLQSRNVVDLLLSQMTVAEKIGQLNLATPGGDTLTGTVTNVGIAKKIQDGAIGGIFGIKSLSAVRAFQDLAMESRLKIPLMFAEDVIHGHRTIFPISLGLASTWNMALIKQASVVAAKEASAEGIDQVYAPMVDVTRDPRWGRIAESPGEDPYFASRYARASVHGFQGRDMADKHSVMSCLKHFVAYGGAEGGRDYDSVDVSARRLHDVYLPPFIAGIKAGAASIMASFNTVNGTPMHAHGILINDVMRRIYNFSGLIVSDYLGIQQLLDHRVAGLEEDAARLSLEAGVDTDMVSELFLTTLEKSVEQKLIDISVIDDACRRVLEAKEKLGLLDDPYRRMKSRPAALLPEHRELARTAAAEACVLLKNDRAVLPIKEGTKIALIGPLADDRVNMNGTWAVSGNSDRSVTLLEGMQTRFSNEPVIFHAKGANIVDDTVIADRLNVHNRDNLSVIIDERDNASMIAEALEKAQAAEMIVAVVGEAKEHSGESSSRTSLEISQQQKDLLRALKETGKPLAIVVMTGRPLVLRDEALLGDALLVSWFGGTEAGNGIADILYGRVNPSGKLTATFPYHEGQIPVYHSHEPTGRPYTGQFNKFSNGYLDLPDDVPHKTGLFPFGHGLSYTTFDHEAPRVKFSRDKECVTVRTRITNSGERAGREVVQLYATDLVAQTSRPVRELKGFEKILLQPGESKDAAFKLTRSDLSFSVAKDISDTSRRWEEGEFVFATGPSSQKLQEIKVYWKAPDQTKYIEYALSL